MKIWIFFSAILAYQTWTFLRRPAPMTEQAVDIITNNYIGNECPFNFTLYRLMDDEYTYTIQLQGRHSGPSVMKRCEVHRHNAESLGEEFTTLKPEHVHVIEHVCNDLQYDVQRDTVDVPNQKCNEDPHHIECGVEVEETEEEGEGEEGATFEGSALPYISNIIYPGTLWCGKGNIADDLYSNLGEHYEEDRCCREHDLCKPAIESHQTRYGETNPSIFTVSHCSCDVKLFNCFKRANTPVSREIGRVFFNLVRMKCFDFEMKDYCLNTLFGFCLRSERRPGAILKSNPHF